MIHNRIGLRDKKSLTNRYLTKECDCMKKKFFVVIAIIVVLVILAIMITAMILLRKNKANFLSFIIPWFVGFVGCLVVVFVIL